MNLYKLQYWISKEMGDFDIDISLTLKANKDEVPKIVQDLVQMDENAVIGLTALAQRMNKAK